MIRPGLLTASTSNADHLGMSGFCVAVWVWFCIFFAPYRSCVLVLRRECFPLAVTLGCYWPPQSTPEGPEQRGGVTDLCSVAGADNGHGEGETIKKISAGMERRGMEAEAIGSLPHFRNLVFFHNGD